MYNLSEQNEQRGRRTALVLAIGLHLALAAALYYFGTQKPGSTDYAGQPTHSTSPIPHPKAVNLP